MTIDDPWKVSEQDFPRSGRPEERLRFMLNYAVLAPSGHNTQPWLFSVGGDAVELHADRTRGLPVVDPEDRALVISCGAALFYLHMAMRHFGYEDEVEVLPDPDDPDLLARVRLGPDHAETEEERMLFQAMPKRRSNRGPFEDRPVPGRLLSALQAAAWEEGAWLHLIEDEDVKHTIAELIAEGDRIQLGPACSSERDPVGECPPLACAGREVDDDLAGVALAMAMAPVRHMFAHERVQIIQVAASRPASSGARRSENECT